MSISVPQDYNPKTTNNTEEASFETFETNKSVYFDANIPIDELGPATKTSTPTGSSTTIGGTENGNPAPPLENTNVQKANTDVSNYFNTGGYINLIFAMQDLAKILMSMSLLEGQIGAKSILLLAELGDASAAAVRAGGKAEVNKMLTAAGAALGGLALQLGMRAGMTRSQTTQARDEFEQKYGMNAPPDSPRGTLNRYTQERDQLLRQQQENQEIQAGPSPQPPQPVDPARIRELNQKINDLKAQHSPYLSDEGNPLMLEKAKNAYVNEQVQRQAGAITANIQMLESLKDGLSSIAQSTFVMQKAKEDALREIISTTQRIVQQGLVDAPAQQRQAMESLLDQILQNLTKLSDERARIVTISTHG